MDGFLLLADGTKLEGELRGGYDSPVTGWLTANTGVVGFTQMLTDPVYHKVLLSFTYPEIGNTGVERASLESEDIQPNALIVREVCSYPSHYRSEQGLLDFLNDSNTVCLSGVDTRWLAVHLRMKGEMPALIASEKHEQEEADLLEKISDLQRPAWEKIRGKASPPQSNDSPNIVLIDLGMRNSFAGQISRCCQPTILQSNATPDTVWEQNPEALIVTDGPAFSHPPHGIVETLKSLTGRLPILACGLGSAALGMAMGCKVEYLQRGHHGANYPVRNIKDNSLENTQQRHSVVLNRGSVEDSENVELAFANVNDGSVEGIRTCDGSALGYQPLLSPRGKDGINSHILDFFGTI